jgi:uncharacterized MnhB-related membrane protein
VGRKILRSGSVGFGLALVVVMRGLLRFFAARERGRLLCVIVEGRLRIIVVLVVMSIVVLQAGDVAMRLACMGRGASQCFTGKQLDSLNLGRDEGWRQAGDVFVPVAVIVVFEVLEDVAHVEKRVAVQADIHESGLHAGKDASNFSFVDAADEGEFFFALDVNFD